MSSTDATAKTAAAILRELRNQVDKHTFDRQMQRRHNDSAAAFLATERAKWVTSWTMKLPDLYEAVAHRADMEGWDPPDERRIDLAIDQLATGGAVKVEGERPKLVRLAPSVPTAPELDTLAVSGPRLLDAVRTRHQQLLSPKGSELEWADRDLAARNLIHFWLRDVETAIDAESNDDLTQNGPVAVPTARERRGQSVGGDSHHEALVNLALLLDRVAQAPLGRTRLPSPPGVWFDESDPSIDDTTKGAAQAFNEGLSTKRPPGMRPKSNRTNVRKAVRRDFPGIDWGAAQKKVADELKAALAAARSYHRPPAQEPLEGPVRAIDILARLGRDHRPIKRQYDQAIRDDRPLPAALDADYWDQPLDAVARVFAHATGCIGADRLKAIAIRIGGGGVLLKEDEGALTALQRLDQTGKTAEVLAKLWTHAAVAAERVGLPQPHAHRREGSTRQPKKLPLDEQVPPLDDSENWKPTKEAAKFFNVGERYLHGQKLPSKGGVCTPDGRCGIDANGRMWRKRPNRDNTGGGRLAYWVGPTPQSPPVSKR